MGPWNLFYFFPVIFFGSYYLVNLMLAVVSLAYEDESQNAIKVKFLNKIYFLIFVKIKKIILFIQKETASSAC